MPLNVRRFFASGSLVLSGFITVNFAQTNGTTTPAAAETKPNANSSSTATTAPAAPPKPIVSKTSAEVMRERISKAKAFIAVKNYSAAIYEMENIRRETNDQSVHGVLNVLLMNSYLEQGDYKRANEFLKELYNLQKSGKPVVSPHYFAVAGQVVKGARNQLERYRALGLSVADRNLPLEATVDIDKMRETLETVIDQSKTIGADKSKTSYAIPLLEEATVSRSSLARDDYDAKRWKDAVGDARDEMANSRGTVLNAVNDTQVAAETPNIPQDTIASNVPVINQTTPSVTNTDEAAAIFKPVAETTNNSGTSGPKAPETPVKPEETTAKTILPVKETARTEETAKTDDKPSRVRIIGNKPADEKAAPQTQTTASNAAAPSAPAVKDGSPMQLGSLLEFATKQTKPVYPAAARTIRQTGVVKVEVLIDETGEVSQIEDASGPSMLQSAAKDAIRKWRFKPFTRDGQPTKAKGYINFNFAL